MSNTFDVVGMTIIARLLIMISHCSEKKGAAVVPEIREEEVT